MDLIVVFFDRSVMFGVQLRRFFGVLISVRGVTGCDMCVMACGFSIAAFVVCSSFTVMSSGLLVVVRCMGMVLVGSVSGRHR